MAIKKITRKIISSKAPVIVEEAPKAVEERYDRESKKVCIFCQKKTKPSYLDLANLRHFLTDRAKILPRGRSGVCSKHQRGVAKNIKYARHLSLLPFVPQV